MIIYEDECVGCSSLGLPCYGSACPNRNVPYVFCDECGDDIDRDSDYHLCDKCRREKEEVE